MAAFMGPFMHGPTNVHDCGRTKLNRGGLKPQMIPIRTHSFPFPDGVRKYAAAHYKLRLT